MSLKELQAVTQKFADAFDQRDLQPSQRRLPATIVSHGGAP
jgi:hypothetical protein